MRYALILITSFFAQITFAAPKDVAAMMKESQAARELAAKEKDATAKIKKLKAFEASLNATIKDYEKELPTEGNEAEEKVVKFSYRFEPLFDLASAKVTKEACEKTRGQIQKDDQTGKPEGAALSANAEEALKWVDVLCK
jgi:hypothetical protein